MTDFFLSLWDAGLSAETIRGYRPALASVFKYSGCTVFDSPEVAALFKNFALERPIRSQEIPQWSLPLVLAFLKGPPFEPLEEASLENLTRKTVFLTVLASGRRRSEVHNFSGLPAAVVFSEAVDRVTLIELPGFLAKNQLPTGSSPLVEIPALTTREGTFDLDRSLCPVRALHLYLERVSAFRGTRRRLFIAPDPAATKEIRADRITKWVRSVVTDAYASAEGVALPEGSVRAHEMRALASSWRAFSHSCSIADLMAAAFWRSSRTFATFYLRDLSADTFDLCALGPLVVAQAVVHPPA